MCRCMPTPEDGRLNWTKVGLKDSKLNFSVNSRVSLNWTKVGLKE